MQYYFRTDGLAVGYNGKILIHDISLNLEKGKILTLIGPNGSGKSTILKTITRQLDRIGGSDYLGDEDINEMSPKELAMKMAVVLTDRIRPELMSCEEVVAMGRYPYTNMFGRLTPEDRAAVEKAISTVHAEDIRNQDFATLSDGQRQRIMLARAICQQPEIIILDEPTAYLDIRYKIELLDILKKMAQQGTTVIMSLHEVDLAMQISDYIVCVKGETLSAFGTPDEILQKNEIENLYDMTKEADNPLWKHFMNT
ncbi:MAG: ABC transporter ATP-binding protein, partial [Firmicutes bacterium]|nr:ABC transporter ATP-binding protein [Bacillota bacterium]